MKSHLTDARPSRPKVALASLVAILAAGAAVLPHVATAAPASEQKAPAKAATSSQGIWPTSTVPKVPSSKDAKSVTLGLVFSSATPGRLRGVQYYAAGANRRATTGGVWNAAGRRIATVKFPKASSNGWKTAVFSSPVKIRAGKKYTVSYRAPHGRYAKQPDVFDRGRTVSTKGLTAHRGTYTYTKGRPTRTWRGSHYFVDVLFDRSGTTSTPTPTPNPTATPTPTTAAGACVKPDASNTGPSGALTAYTGPAWVSTPGTVIENKTITGDLTLGADNITVRNSTVTGRITVQNAKGARVSQVATQGFTVSSAQDAVLDRSDIGFSTLGDAMHVTSDNGARASDIVITNNYVHDPRPNPGEHFDGLQVRGVDGIRVFCNSYDFGAPDQHTHNSPVYLEGGANGGISGAVIDNNWLFGGAFGVMYGADNDGQTRLTNNHFGGDYVWGPDSTCYSPNSVPAVQTGNDLRGVPFTPCRL